MSQPPPADPAAWWSEIAAGVLVRRHRELDLSTGLIIGSRSCLVVDTCGDHRQGTALAAAIRERTSLPWIVVYTHAHFDHCFGTEPFLPCPVWAHAGLPAVLTATASRQRDEWAARYREQGRPDLADDLAASSAVPPDHTVGERVELDLGGRTAVLEHLGRGHTDHDLIVSVPDVDVVFTGDLIEQGAPPAVEDSFPREWADLATALARRGTAGTRFVPGHGHPVDTAFVRTQAAGLRTLVEQAEALGGVSDASGEEPTHPFGAAVVRAAAARLA
ncbi:glyoxylase-like metal-dependent hydrolase (beta-lactamase superfamily II) [Actinoalloteichus hoggarensis]|uniref:Metallo-beta-lactamase superfamily protein n=1 Tax=Actinoalloteichus hoggarensis TaxID=1470176 RepID=A0A221W042_9PSEU|nr:MBL fold metallo-hydrolase [Actinoalloteichus hoggarensis]ASO19139.1 Metallo-beta-lactamase superfamily protein [Actinoalloteichus hoggarensis]MBB5920375.1 glyoxylase-like metal-dependent hydrolase (beta-lactamase superfamily II) [Actinoalloteichus hoggarensis]